MKRALALSLLAMNAACGLIAGLSDHQLDPGDESIPTDGAPPSDSAPDATMPTKLVTLARGQADPRGISADGAMIYWANQSGASVAAVAKDGSQSMPTILSNQAKHPRSTQVNASQIFWGGDTADTEDDCQNSTVQVGIIALDKAADASPHQVYCDQFMAMYVGSLTIDGTDIYWTNSRFTTGVVVRTRASSAATAFVDMQASESVALNTTTVFWSRNDGIAQWPKSDFPPEAGAVTPFVTATSAALGLGVDEENVYFTTPSSIMKAAISGGAAIELAPAQDGPSALALYGDNVYWTNAGAGTVMTIPKAGGTTPRMLASGQGSPSSIVVDDKGVFWTNASGEVMGLLP